MILFIFHDHDAIRCFLLPSYFLNVLSRYIFSIKLGFDVDVNAEEKLCLNDHTLIVVEKPNSFRRRHANFLLRVKHDVGKGSVGSRNSKRIRAPQLTQFLMLIEAVFL